MLSINRLVAARYRHPLREFTFTLYIYIVLTSDHPFFQATTSTKNVEVPRPLRKTSLSYFQSLLVTRLWDTIRTFPILSFQSSPLSFEDGLVLLATSPNRGRLIASTRSRARNLSQIRYSASSIFATGCSY